MWRKAAELGGSRKASWRDNSAVGTLAHFPDLLLSLL
jgi:hypothetical protein